MAGCLVAVPQPEHAIEPLKEFFCLGKCAAAFLNKVRDRKWGFTGLDELMAILKYIKDMPPKEMGLAI